LAASLFAQSNPRLLKYALDILTVLVALPGFPPALVKPALSYLVLEDRALSASALRFFISHLSESPASAHPSLFPDFLSVLSTCVNVTVAGHCADLFIFLLAAHADSARSLLDRVPARIMALAGIW
jgi:hypothetical protein